MIHTTALCHVEKEEGDALVERIVTLENPSLTIKVSAPRPPPRHTQHQGRGNDTHGGLFCGQSKGHTPFRNQHQQAKEAAVRAPLGGTGGHQAAGVGGTFPQRVEKPRCQLVFLARISEDSSFSPGSGGRGGTFGQKGKGLGAAWPSEGSQEGPGG